MNHTNGLRKSLRLVMVLAALAWVTQLFFTQLGYGAEPTPNDTANSETQEKFVPGTLRYLAGATLELRSEATITGGEVRLKQVCRWSDADKAAFEPVADFVVARMGSGSAYRSLSLTELKTLLQDGGVNLAVIHFAGTTSCTINRSDITSDERGGLQDWINARQGNNPPAKVEPKPTSQPAMANAQLASAAQPAKVIEITPIRTLRELLVADLAERLSLDPLSLQMKFSPADEKLLALSEPHFRFDIDGQRARGLGPVSWQINILAGGGSQKATVDATARAWQDQLVVIKPLAYHATIQSEDLADRRALIDQLSGEPTIKREQVVGQWAGQELRAGTIVTPRLIEAAPLVKTGQLVTVIAEQGSVKVRAVARALEGGSFGQVIKLKNEATGDTYEATLTGPQEAKVSATAPSDRPHVATVAN